MNKEVCFRINSKDLILEQVLVEYNKIPLYFVCKDSDGHYFIVLCTDIDHEKYIIVSTQIDKLKQLLTQKITMRNMILSEDKFWDVLAGETIESDKYELKEMDAINLEDLPMEDSYFEVATKAHEDYLVKLINLSLFRTDEWTTVNSLVIDHSQEIDLRLNKKIFPDRSVAFKEVIEVKDVKNIKVELFHSDNITGSIFLIAA